MHTAYLDCRQNQVRRSHGAQHLLHLAQWKVAIQKRLSLFSSWDRVTSSQSAAPCCPYGTCTAATPCHITADHVGGLAKVAAGIVDALSNIDNGAAHAAVLQRHLLRCVKLWKGALRQKSRRQALSCCMASWTLPATAVHQGGLLPQMPLALATRIK